MHRCIVKSYLITFIENISILYEIIFCVEICQIIYVFIVSFQSWVDIQRDKFVTNGINILNHVFVYLMILSILI